MLLEVLVKAAVESWYGTYVCTNGCVLRLGLGGITHCNVSHIVW